jgi:hypothetical protein
MEPSFSLEYYDRIFGVRGDEFWELVQALRDELESYIDELAAAANARDLQALSQLRHMHRPITMNLHLDDLRALETATADAVRTKMTSEHLRALVQDFELHARAVIQGLGDLIPGP